MKKNGVTVIQASARLAGAGRLALDNGGTLSARHIILATGARARELPALPLGERIWAYRQALVPDAVPKSLLVVGAGAIGAEFASFYRAVGADVTLIDWRPPRSCRRKTPRSRSWRARPSRNKASAC